MTPTLLLQSLCFLNSLCHCTHVCLPTFQPKKEYFANHLKHNSTRLQIGGSDQRKTGRCDSQFGIFGLLEF
jgi:hypothetical protein